MDQIAILLGGRIAEEITNGQLTTGAGNDLERVTEVSRAMVCEWGMSDDLGPLTFGKREEQIFLGREIAKTQDYSEETAVAIDSEVKRFVMDELRSRARTCSPSTRRPCSRSPTSCSRAKCSTPIRSIASSRACRSRSRAAPVTPPTIDERREARRSAPDGRRWCRRSASRSGRNRPGIINLELGSQNFEDRVNA